MGFHVLETSCNCRAVARYGLTNGAMPSSSRCAPRAETSTFNFGRESRHTFDDATQPPQDESAEEQVQVTAGPHATRPHKTNPKGSGVPQRRDSIDG